jgi:phospholipid/cholesterol/gamma-HCH transport system substrate-binding protein
MNTRTARRRRVGTPTGKLVIRSTGLAGIAAIAAMALIGYFAPNRLPLRKYYNLQATFARADGLVDHTDVKLDGERIGQVLDTRIVDGTVKARLQLDAGVKPLTSTLTLRVRPRGLLGVVYVDIAPGPGGRPLPDGASIPAGRSVTTTQLDDVLNTLDPATRQRTQTLLRQLGDGVAGRGEDLNRLAQQAPGYVADLERAALAVNERVGATGRFVHATDRVLSATDAVREELSSSFDPAARALAPFADQAAQWRATLSAFPPTLVQARAHLASTDPLLDSLSRLATRLTRTLKPAPSALHATAGLLREARPALVKLPRTLALARRATPPTAAFARRLDTQLPLLARGLRPGNSIAKEVGPHGCDLRAFLGHWAEHDALGDEGLNYLRATVTLAPQEGVSTDTKRRPDIYGDAYPAKPCTAGWEYLKP